MTYRKRLGKNQSKILLLLLAGIAIGLSRSPRKQWKIIKDIPKEFERVNIQGLEYGLHRLYEEKYINLKSIGNGIYAPYLTKEGRLKARRYSADELDIPTPVRWDKKWRLVFFDIPEKYKGRRNDFRYKLKKLGFKEIQKSVFCYPYPCGEEIMRIAEFLYLTNYIKYAVTEELSDDQTLRQYFNLK